MNQAMALAVKGDHDATTALLFGDFRGAPNTCLDKLRQFVELEVTQTADTARRASQMTQQNAALVEESSATAASLHSQATELTQAVAVFRTD